MKCCTPSVLVLAGATLAAALVAEQRPGPADFVLLQGGVAVEVPASGAAALSSSLVAYFETCRTYEAVTGEAPSQDSLRSTWQEQSRGPHALVTLDGAQGTAAREPRLLLIGFSAGSPAWPVLTRDTGDLIVLYSKCDGLEGSVLACDVGEFIPEAAPQDCERLRQLQRQQVSSSEKSVGEPLVAADAAVARSAGAGLGSPFAGRQSLPPASPLNSESVRRRWN